VHRNGCKRKRELPARPHCCESGNAIARDPKLVNPSKSTWRARSGPTRIRRRRVLAADCDAHVSPRNLSSFRRRKWAAGETGLVSGGISLPDQSKLPRSRQRPGSRHAPVERLHKMDKLNNCSSKSGSGGVAHRVCHYFANEVLASRRRTARVGVNGTRPQAAGDRA
jgi:hypothetical protein